MIGGFIINGVSQNHHAVGGDENFAGLERRQQSGSFFAGEKGGHFV